jgi:uncharacterized protein (DUF58 family)
VTARGFVVAVLSAMLVPVGWRLGWPELTALGGAGLTFVVIAAGWAGRTPRASLSMERSSLRVTRGETAQVRVSVTAGHRRRWLRLVDGRVAAPVRSVGMPKRREVGPTVLKMPLDTSRRGMSSLGPYTLVHGDPWSVVRRLVAVADGGSLTVLPRVHPLSRSVWAKVTVDESELSSRHAGDQHFHALRDYVLGDEPRTIHWRSTARAGHLVVRQQVAAATNGTTVILDTSSAAYASDERFGSGWIEERFEHAVEVAASLCVADLGRNEQITLLTTSRGSTPVSSVAGSTGGFLDALAMVSQTQPVDTAPDDLPLAVRRTRCARAILVSGSPSPTLLEAMRRVRVAGASVVVIRMGSTASPPVSQLRIIDLAHADELDGALGRTVG